MSTLPPAHRDLPPPGDRYDWLPSRRGLLLVALALVAGLVVFAMVWRGESDGFYSVQPVARPTSAREFDPLPAPLPANRNRGASGMDEVEERERAAERARRAEQVPEPVPTIEPGDLPPIESPEPVPAGVTQSPLPLPGQSPPPTYPRRALRRGDEGVVLLRVDVSAEGIPTSVGIVRSSRSRELDRAAVDAVERWRFQPALSGGRPVAGSIDVPIEFNAQR